MEKIIYLPNTAKLHELEGKLDSIQSQMDVLEQKMNLSCRSGIPIKDNTKEGLFALLAQSMEISEEIRRLRGFTEDDDKRIFEHYEETVKRGEKRIREFLTKELPALPETEDEKRVVLYQWMKLYIAQVMEAIKQNASFKEIFAIWEKYEFTYDLILDEDYSVFDALEEENRIEFTEYERINGLNLLSLCEELDKELAKRDEYLMTSAFIKAQYIEKLYIYHTAILNALSDRNLK